MACEYRQATCGGQAGTVTPVHAVSRPWIPAERSTFGRPDTTFILPRSMLYISSIMSFVFCSYQMSFFCAFKSPKKEKKTTKAYNGFEVLVVNPSKQT